MMVDGDGRWMIFMGWWLGMSRRMMRKLGYSYSIKLVEIKVD